ncbi:hypothetical protein L901_18210 [Agrobacterium sp. D14]|nr:hypothetical protein L901_18210 [Agrobacterium sp. D14]
MLIRMQQSQLDRDVDPDGGEALRRQVANLPQRWTGPPMGFAPFHCSEPFPFYVARIDDRLLLRPTPEGVRLGRNFCEIRFQLFASGGK